MDKVLDNFNIQLEFSACLEVQEFLRAFNLSSSLYSLDGTCLNSYGVAGCVDQANSAVWPDCIGGRISELTAWQLETSDASSNCDDYQTFREVKCPCGGMLISIPVYNRRNVAAYLAVCLSNMSVSKTEDIQRLCDKLKIDSVYIVENLLADIVSSSRLAPILSLMIHRLLEKTRQCNESNVEIEAVSSSLAQSYEELSLLHRISDNMRINQTPLSFFEKFCCDIQEVVEAGELLIIWYDVNEASLPEGLATSRPYVVSSSQPPLKSEYVDLIWDRTRELTAVDGRTEAGKYLIDSNVDSPFIFNWPKPINSIISVPISCEQNIVGAVAAINKENKPDFDSIDAKLLLSFTNDIAAFLDNNRLYDDLRDLMLGSLMALTSSIDAKDPYTCGHSERVAIISRFIAEKLNLDDKQMHNIYLGGLLHDVGKIGVSELVLCKPGRLTEQEFDQMKEHPQIGANILGGIKQMAGVLDGVISHHERFDGNGYPRGLAGRSIPLAGRIVMIADAFDAMTSNRTYRNALALNTVLADLRRFSGTQFDPELTDVFLNSDIDGLMNQLKGSLHNNPLDGFYRPTLEAT